MKPCGAQLIIGIGPHHPVLTGMALLDVPCARSQHEATQESSPYGTQGLAAAQSMDERALGHEVRHAARRRAVEHSPSSLL